MTTNNEIHDAVKDMIDGVTTFKKNQVEWAERFEERLDRLEVDGQKSRELGGSGRVETKAGGVGLGLETKVAGQFRRSEGDGFVLSEDEAKQVRLGALIAARVAGVDRLGDSLSDAEQKSVLSGLTGGAGGFTIDSSVSSMFIDAARARTFVLRAGGRTVPMDASEVRLPGWETPPAAAWRNETNAFAESTAVFRAVVLRAKSLAASVPITVELIEDAASNLGAVSAIIETALQKAAAVEIDRAALNGSGTDFEPLGLLNVPGVTGPTSVGSLTFDDLITLHFDVAEANHENGAFLLAPRDEENLAQLKESTTDAYLAPPSVLAPIPRYVTNNVPTTLGGGAESVVFAGDFSYLVIGVRPSLALRTQIDPFSKMASNGEVLVNAYLRCDVAVLDTTAFSVATGVTA